MDRIVRLKEVLSVTGLSRSTVCRRIQEQRFPAQIVLGGNSVGWREAELERWIADPSGYRAEARDSLSAPA